MIVPWVLYERYGDQGLLETQYPSMRRWVDYVASRLSADAVWEGDWQYGDWLDPAASPHRPWEGLTEPALVATAYAARTAFVVAEAAGLAFAEVEGPGSTLLGVSAERDELRRLIEQLPDDRVQAVLAEARRQGGSVPAGEWPPSWFGSFASGRSDLGSNHDDLLAEGFGRS